MIEWRLHLDDDARKEGMEDFRYPPEGDETYHVATSSVEAMALVEKHGFPTFMQLDCDLGLMDQPEDDRAPLSKMPIKVPDTAMRFVKWLYEKYPNEEPFWNIHSMNGIAAKNLNSFLEGWKKSIDSSGCPDQCMHQTCIEKFLPDDEEYQFKGNISEACLHSPPGTTIACPTGCGCWCDVCEATRKK